MRKPFGKLTAVVVIEGESGCRGCASPKMTSLTEVVRRQPIVHQCFIGVFQGVFVEAEAQMSEPSSAEVTGLLAGGECAAVIALSDRKEEECVRDHAEAHVR